MASKEEAIGYLKALISAEKGERLPQPEFGKDRLRVLEKIVEAFEGEGSGIGSGGSTGGGVLVVHANEVEGGKKAATRSSDTDRKTYRLDRTWQEIKDADLAVIRTDITFNDEQGTANKTATFYVVSVYSGTDDGIAFYSVYAYIAEDNNFMSYVTTSADGYPECMTE